MGQCSGIAVNHRLENTKCVTSAKNVTSSFIMASGCGQKLDVLITYFSEPNTSSYSATHIYCSLKNIYIYNGYNQWELVSVTRLPNRSSGVTLTLEWCGVADRAETRCCLGGTPLAVQILFSASCLHLDICIHLGVRVCVHQMATFAVCSVSKAAASKTIHITSVSWHLLYTCWWGCRVNVPSFQYSWLLQALSAD